MQALCARDGSACVAHAPACVQGRLRCLGSPSRLKARYGGALALEVQAGAGAAAQAALAAWAAAELGAELQVRPRGGRVLMSPNKGEGFRVQERPGPLQSWAPSCRRARSWSPNGVHAPGLGVCFSSGAV